LGPLGFLAIYGGAILGFLAIHDGATQYGAIHSGAVGSHVVTERSPQEVCSVHFPRSRSRTFGGRSTYTGCRRPLGTGC
jgi:hypothetical protein